jgi:hypothetical protein
MLIANGLTRAAGLMLRYQCGGRRRPNSQRTRALLSTLILRSIAKQCVSKDEGPGASWFETRFALLTMRIVLAQRQRPYPCFSLNTRIVPASGRMMLLDRISGQEFSAIP